MLLFAIAEPWGYEPFLFSDRIKVINDHLHFRCGDNLGKVTQNFAKCYEEKKRKQEKERWVEWERDSLPSRRVTYIRSGLDSQKKTCEICWYNPQPHNWAMRSLLISIECSWEGGGGWGGVTMNTNNCRPDRREQHFSIKKRKDALTYLPLQLSPNAPTGAIDHEEGTK